MSDTKISDAAVEAAADLLHGMESASTMRDARELATMIITTIIPHLISPPAELAEQQGAEWNDSARLAYLESFAREPGGLLLHAESKTGRRGLGLGENCGNRTLAQAIDGCATHAEKARFSALAATGKQQGGEVQGCDELRMRTNGEKAAYLEGVEEGKMIAARQPVGEITDCACIHYGLGKAPYICKRHRDAASARAGHRPERRNGSGVPALDRFLPRG